jgi:hypothetical protein
MGGIEASRSSKTIQIVVIPGRHSLEVGIEEATQQMASKPPVAAVVSHMAVYREFTDISLR